MGIGGSIFLIALGAILAFAVDGRSGLAEPGRGRLGAHARRCRRPDPHPLLLEQPPPHGGRRPGPPGRVVAEPVVPVQDDRVVEEYREVRRPGYPA